eukprot:239767-Amorphochlora_amoeboformis.AAC.1
MAETDTKNLADRARSKKTDLDIERERGEREGERERKEEIDRGRERERGGGGREKMIHYVEKKGEKFTRIMLSSTPEIRLSSR